MFICRDSGCAVMQDDATAQDLIDAGLHPKDAEAIIGIIQKHREANIEPLTSANGKGE